MRRLSLMMIFLIPLIIYSQETGTEEIYYPQPTNLVYCPTAGVLARGSYEAEFRMYSRGGLMGGIYVGLTKAFMFGISYGGTNIIGEDDILWNVQPGVEVKYRLYDETVKYPAVTLGLNTQGFGEFFRGDTLNRYEMKAKGIYLAASKNYRFFGNLGFHGGVNYNFLENKDGDGDPSFWFGIDKDINPELSIVIEYDAALNDNQENKVALNLIGRKGYGYLNAGIRWTFVSHLHFDLNFNNILLNKEGVTHFSREMKITYIEFF